MEAGKEKPLLEAAGKTGLWLDYAGLVQKAQQSSVAAGVWWREGKEAGAENALKPGAGGNGNERLGLKKSLCFHCS